MNGPVSQTIKRRAKHTHRSGCCARRAPPRRTEGAPSASSRTPSRAARGIMDGGRRARASVVGSGVSAGKRGLHQHKRCRVVWATYALLGGFGGHDKILAEGRSASGRRWRRTRMRTAAGVPPKPQSRTSHVIVSVPGHKAPLPLPGDQDQRHVREPSERIAIT